MTLNDVITRIRNEEAISPGELAAMRMFLSGEYAYISGQLESVLMRKADTWLVLREKTGSDKQADKQWDASSDGKLETAYRLQLKSIEKISSAIKTRLDIAAGEARNQF